MRVVGYVRVSTDEQATGGVSVEAQEQKVRAYCGLYGLDLVELLVDAGQSAKSMARPGLSAARGLLDSGGADGLVVAKLDRLTRSVADLAVLLDRHFGEAAGKQLFSVGDSIDTRTAAGRLVLNVLMSVAQWERETVVERTCDAIRHKKARGERTGSVPYGYGLDPDGPRNRHGRPQRLVPEPAELDAIAKMQSMRARGHSPQTIAGHLNDLGLPTKTGKAGWTRTAVAKILARPLLKEKGNPCLP